MVLAPSLYFCELASSAVRKLNYGPTMHLMYSLDENGKRVYTLKKVVDGRMTKSAHPARFSPDDKYQRYCPGSRLQSDTRHAEIR